MTMISRDLAALERELIEEPEDLFVDIHCLLEEHVIMSIRPNVLKRLNLQFNGEKNGLRYMPSLEDIHLESLTLKMERCNLNEYDIEILKFPKSLTHLNINLSRNWITNDGIANLVNSIGQLHNLTTLSLDMSASRLRNEVFDKSSLCLLTKLTDLELILCENSNIDYIDTWIPHCVTDLSIVVTNCNLHSCNFRFPNGVKKLELYMENNPIQNFGFLLATDIPKVNLFVSVIWEVDDLWRQMYSRGWNLSISQPYYG